MAASAIGGPSPPRAGPEPWRAPAERGSPPNRGPHAISKIAWGPPCSPPAPEAARPQSSCPAGTRIARRGGTPRALRARGVRAPTGRVPAPRPRGCPPVRPPKGGAPPSGERSGARPAPSGHGPCGRGACGSARRSVRHAHPVGKLPHSYRAAAAQLEGSCHRARGQKPPSEREATTLLGGSSHTAREQLSHNRRAATAQRGGSYDPARGQRSSSERAAITQ